MAKLSIFFEDIIISSAGFEIENIIGGRKYLHTGEIDHIVIEDVSGGLAATADVQIRYISGDSERQNLVYLFESGTLPSFIDSNIKGSFSLRNFKDLIDGDLHLFILPDVAGVFNIRVDFNIDNRSGL